MYPISERLGRMIQKFRTHMRTDSPLIKRCRKMDNIEKSDQHYDR